LSSTLLYPTNRVLLNVMRRVEGTELERIRHHFQAAANEAQLATCLRAHCGSVIVSKAGEIIGRGHNAPPLDDETQRTCDSTWDYSKKPKYDLTCCVHAEWNACLGLLKNNAAKVDGSVLYFMRINEKGDFTDAGEPFCTTCSRITMQTGVAEFALWNNNGADVYASPEYNRLSYEYFDFALPKL
jgi:deoxycytidylate deaminase